MKKIVFLTKSTMRFDSRVKKISLSLAQNSYDVTVIAEKLYKDLKKTENKEYNIYRVSTLSGFYSTESSVSSEKEMVNSHLSYLQKIIKYIKYMKLRTYIFITLNRIFWNLGALIKIISINPDLIIGRDPNTLLISYVASKLLNKPIIYEPHEIWDSSNLYLRSTKPMQVYWNLVEKLLIKKVNITFTTTESKRKILSERYGVDNVYVLRSTSPFRELRHSINLKKQYNIPEDKLLLIYHGQLGRIRGVFDLVDAIKDLDDYVLLFMGMGNDIYELMQYVKQLSLNHKIFFKDAVNPDDIVENIASADIGIQPFHYSENIYNEISNKLLECIMAELPTIGVDFPEIKRIIIGENIGFVYKSGDIKQLKIVLQEIAQNRCILNKFKENCRNIKHQYSWEIDEKILLEKVRTLI